MKKIAASAGVVVLMAVMAASALASESYPSTNEWNKTGQNPHYPGVIGPHVSEVSAEDGQVTLAFWVPAGEWACFDWRADGNTTIRNVCVSNGGSQHTFEVSEKIEVRMINGSDPNWYFDWTVFPEGSGTPDPDNPPDESGADDSNVSDPETRAECMRGGWQDFGFRNQGQCIRFVNTGSDSR